MVDLRIIALSGLLALAACGQTDREITRGVEARLASEGVAEQVKVTTERRVVVLEGVVADRATADRIEVAARHTPGILGVDNRLVVQAPVDLTGGDIDESDKPAQDPTTAPPSPTLPVAP